MKEVRGVIGRKFFKLIQLQHSNTLELVHILFVIFSNILNYIIVPVLTNTRITNEDILLLLLVYFFSQPDKLTNPTITNLHKRIS